MLHREAGGRLGVYVHEKINISATKFAMRTIGKVASEEAVGTCTAVSITIEIYTGLGGHNDGIRKGACSVTSYLFFLI